MLATNATADTAQYPISIGRRSMHVVPDRYRRLHIITEVPWTVLPNMILKLTTGYLSASLLHTTDTGTADAHFNGQPKVSFVVCLCQTVGENVHIEKHWEQLHRNHLISVWYYHGILECCYTSFGFLCTCTGQMMHINITLPMQEPPPDVDVGNIILQPPTGWPWIGSLLKSSAHYWHWNC
jgi:hypothetical protein